MDQELKAKWVEALRSGTYVQGKQRLLQPDGTRCCLGVLCAVIGIENSELEKPENNGIRHPPVLHQVIEGDPSRKLTWMNDETADFSQIAAYIEANL